MPSHMTNEQDKDTGNKSPYDGVVGQVVRKIKNEPFLFVIGIAALLVGLATLGTKLGSSDFRIIVVVIASLSFLVIVGYYFRDTSSQTVGKPKRQAPNLPPVFIESKTFDKLSTFSQKKEILIHPYQEKIENGTLELTKEQQNGCAASPWDFDRIVLYIYEEHSKKTKFYQRQQRITQEWEKLRASEGKRSLIPLHYSIRSTLRYLEKKEKITQEERSSLPSFRKMFEYLKVHYEIDQGGEVKTNITSIIDILRKRTK